MPSSLLIKIFGGAGDSAAYVRRGDSLVLVKKCFTGRNCGSHDEIRRMVKVSEGYMGFPMLIKFLINEISCKRQPE